MFFLLDVLQHFIRVVLGTYIIIAIMTNYSKHLVLHVIVTMNSVGCTINIMDAIRVSKASYQVLSIHLCSDMITFTLRSATSLARNPQQHCWAPSI